jgi:hypothetical protein
MTIRIAGSSIVSSSSSSLASCSISGGRLARWASASRSKRVLILSTKSLNCSAAQSDCTRTTVTNRPGRHVGPAVSTPRRCERQRARRHLERSSMRWLCGRCPRRYTSSTRCAGCSEWSGTAWTHEIRLRVTHRLRFFTASVRGPGSGQGIAIANGVGELRNRYGTGHGHNGRWDCPDSRRCSATSASGSRRRCPTALARR